MVPKTIHCCWLGDKPKDALSSRCRESWSRFAPGWTVREWTLGDIRECGVSPPHFFRTAIARKKWAFAADWVRFLALYREGGVYFDYDFELVAPFDDLISDDGFVAGQWLPDGSVGMEPAVTALPKASPIAKAMLDRYESASFDGYTTVGAILAERLAASHLSLTTLPPEVFSPIDVSGVCRRTAETRGIHHYAMSWASPRRKVAKWLSWHGLRGVVDFLLAVKRSAVRK